MYSLIRGRRWAIRNRDDYILAMALLAEADYVAETTVRYVSANEQKLEIARQRFEVVEQAKEIGIV